LGKLTITPLKFEDDLILYHEVLEFEFYPLEVWKCLDFTSWYFKIWILPPIL